MPHRVSTLLRFASVRIKSLDLVKSKANLVSYLSLSHPLSLPSTV